MKSTLNLKLPPRTRMNHSTLSPSLVLNATPAPRHKAQSSSSSPPLPLLGYRHGPLTRARARPRPNLDNQSTICDLDYRW